jgi:hypothetical protein
LILAPRETWRDLRSLDADLAHLLEVLVHESREAFPQLRSLTLYGGIPLGEFSPSFSDINVAAFSASPLDPEATASALGLWSRLVRRHDDLARRLVLTALPLPGIPPRAEESPLGFQIRSRWEDGRVLCRAVWRQPFSELDLVSLTWQGHPLLGDSPRHFLRAPTLTAALIAHGRREIERLFLGNGRRLFMRTFRRAHRPGMSRIDESRYVKTVLGLTRLLQSLQEERLVAHSESGYWFRRRFGGIAGRFAYDVASYRLRPEVYPEGFLARRARFFPQFARMVLEEVAPRLYKRSLSVSSEESGGSLTEWDQLSEAVAGQIFG